MWTSGRAVSLHVALALFVPACVALTWWQAARALEGNTLSWVYTFEWPIFAAYATYMWWKLVHEEPVSASARGAVPAGPAGAAGGDGPAGPDDHNQPDDPDDPGERVGPDEIDDELAAYNRYLAELNASGRQKRW